MAAALPEITERLPGNPRVILGHSFDSDVSGHEQLVNAATRDGISGAIDDGSQLDITRRRQPSHVGKLDRLGARNRLWLGAQNRDER